VPERIALLLPNAPTSTDVARAIRCHLEHICEEEELVRVVVVAAGLLRATAGRLSEMPAELLVHATRSLFRFDVHCGPTPADGRATDAVYGLIGISASADRWGMMCQPDLRLWAEIDRG
jgi:hypothetical protein